MAPLIDTGRYIRNISFNQANFVVGVLIGLVMSPFIVRQLGDAANGYWSLVVAITAYFGYFELGLHSAVHHYVTRHLADGHTQRLNDKFNSALTVLLGIGGLAVLGTLFLSATLPTFFRVPAEAHEPVRVALLLTGLVTAAKFPAAAFNAVLIGAQRYDLTSGTALVVRVINAIIVFYALTAQQHLLVLAIIVACTQLLESFILMVLALRVVPVLRVRLFRFRWPEFRELFDYGIFNFIINVFAQFGVAFGAITVGRFIDASAVTYYTISLDIIPYMGSVIFAISLPLLQILIPMDVSGDIAALRVVFLKGSRYLGALTCLMAANLLLVGPAFLGQWMGHKYLDSEPYGSSGVVLILLTIGSTMALFATLAQNVLLGRRKNKIYAAVIIAETIGIVVLSLWLVQIWGIIGVAVATIVPPVIAQTIGLNAIAAHYAETTFWQFLREAMLPNFAVLAVVCALGGAVLHLFPPHGWISILLSFTMVSVLYLALTALFVIERPHLRQISRVVVQAVDRLLRRPRPADQPD